MTKTNTQPEKETYFDFGDVPVTGSEGGEEETFTGDDGAVNGFENLNVQEMANVRQLQDFTVASRIVAYCHLKGSSQFDLTVPLPEWQLSTLVKLSCMLSGFGSSNLSEQTIGSPVQAQIDEAKNFAPSLILASFKIAREAPKCVLTQISLAKELSKLCSAAYYNDGAFVICKVPAFNIEVRLGNQGPYTSVVVAGGEAACKQLSIARGAEITFLDVPPQVLFITSLMLPRRSAQVESTAEGNQTVFKVIERKWDVNMMGPDPEVDKNTARLLARWSELLTLESLKFVAPQMMSIRSPEYLNCLGVKVWNKTSKVGKDNLAACIASYIDGTKRVQDLMNFFSTEKPEDPKLTAWLNATDIQGERRFAVKVPSGIGGTTILSTYKAVDDHGEKLRNLRAGKDFVRKQDSPGMTAFAQSSSSVPAKFAYAYNKMENEGVDFHKKAIDAFGVSKKNHWEQFLVETANANGSNLVFKDIVPEYRPKGSSLYELADITRLAPDSGKGKVLFDDTYIVNETPAMLLKRKTDANAPAGPHACYKKLPSILAANYDAGIIKMTLGSESLEPSRVGAIPTLVAAFREKYNCVIFFPGGTAHTQEYLLGFARTEKGMFLRPSVTNDLLDTSGYMEVEHWKRYTRSWYIARCIDFIRANKLNTYKVFMGVFGQPFSPFLRSYAHNRDYKLAFTLSGAERPKGSTIGDLTENNNNNVGGGDDGDVDFM